MIDATVPTLAKIWTEENHQQLVSMSGLCHLLIFYGLGPTDIPSVPTGRSALEPLVDEAAAVRVFGHSPFVQTPQGIRYLTSNDPVFRKEIGEDHRDQCLATFASINLPLDTPIALKAGRFAVRDLLNESVAGFGFEEKEPAWTAIAYAHYLPPQKSWRNRFGETTSFAQLTHHLMEIELSSQSCGGTHIVQALLAIVQADRAHTILDQRTREQVEQRLQLLKTRLIESQLSDGSWSLGWYDHDGRNHLNDSEPTRLLVTGHLLETALKMDVIGRPPKTTLTAAAVWLRNQLERPIPNPRGVVCPITHAAKAARTVLTEVSTMGNVSTVVNK